MKRMNIERYEILTIELAACAANLAAAATVASIIARAAMVGWNCRFFCT